MTAGVMTEQAWLGNPPWAAERLAVADAVERRGIERILAGLAGKTTSNEGTTEMGSTSTTLAPAQKPFASTLRLLAGREYPRAGLRLRPDGRWQLQIWVQPGIPAPAFEKASVERHSEAFDAGRMLAHFGRVAMDPAVEA